ncbi:MAG: alpha/beta hydrolase family protein, partial [Planctomycetota bacterium]
MRAIRLAVLLVVVAFGPVARAQDDPGARGEAVVTSRSLVAEPAGDWKIPIELRVPAGVEKPPLVVIQHGYTHRASFWLPLAEHLASRGFAVAVVDQPNPLDVDPSVWARRLRAAVDALEKDGSFDFERVAILGHSYGGVAATLLAAEDPRVKTVVSVAAGGLFVYRDRYLRAAEAMKQPLLAVSAETDTIVPTSIFSRPAFERARNARERLYVEVKGAGHLRFADVPLPGGDDQRATLARHATGWLEGQLGLRGDSAEWIDGR